MTEPRFTPRKSYPTRIGHVADYRGLDCDGDAIFKHFIGDRVELHQHRPDGRFTHGGDNHDFDIVLPPREWWITLDSDGVVMGGYSTPPQGFRSVIHVREVQPEVNHD